jgi:hypothetical protein
MCLVMGVVGRRLERFCSLGDGSGMESYARVDHPAAKDRPRRTPHSTSLARVRRRGASLGLGGLSSTSFYIERCTFSFL